MTMRVVPGFGIAGTMAGTMGDDFDPNSLDPTQYTGETFDPSTLDPTQYFDPSTLDPTQYFDPSTIEAVDPLEIYTPPLEVSSTPLTVNPTDSTITGTLTPPDTSLEENAAVLNWAASTGISLAATNPAAAGLSASDAATLQALIKTAQTAAQAGNSAAAQQAQAQANALIAARASLPAVASAGTSWFSQQSLIAGMSNAEALGIGGAGLLLASVVLGGRSKGKKR